jgi:hypothetical protein
LQENLTATASNVKDAHASLHTGDLECLVQSPRQVCTFTFKELLKSFAGRQVVFFVVPG